MEKYPVVIKKKYQKLSDFWIKTNVNDWYTNLQS